LVRCIISVRLKTPSVVMIFKAKKQINRKLFRLISCQPLSQTFFYDTNNFKTLESHFYGRLQAAVEIQEQNVLKALNAKFKILASCIK